MFVGNDAGRRGLQSWEFLQSGRKSPTFTIEKIHVRVIETEPKWVYIRTNISSMTCQKIKKVNLTVFFNSSNVSICWCVCDASLQMVNAWKICIFWSRPPFAGLTWPDPNTLSSSRMMSVVIAKIALHLWEYMRL